MEIQLMKVYFITIFFGILYGFLKTHLIHNLNFLSFFLSFFFYLLYKMSFSNQTHSLFQYISKVQLHKKCIFLFLDIYSDTGTPTI